MNTMKRMIATLMLLVSGAASASDFYIEIDQALADKLIDAVCKGAYPCTVYNSNAQASLTGGDVASQLSITDAAPSVQISMAGYFAEAVEAAASADASALAQMAQAFDTAGADTILSAMSVGSVPSPTMDMQLAGLQAANELQAQNEQLAVGLLIVTEYIVEEEGPGSADYADAMAYLCSVGSSGCIADAAMVFATADEQVASIQGLGSSIKKRLKKVGKWIKKKIKKVAKKVFELGETRLDYLIVQLQERPDVKLGNPLKLRKVRINPIFKVSQHYRLFGKKMRVSLSSSSVRVDTGVDMSIDDSTETLALKPRFTKLRFSVKIAGVKVKIGLTGIANKLLAKKGPLNVFDASTLTYPFKPLPVTVSLDGKVQVPASSSSLKIRTNLKFD